MLHRLLPDRANLHANYLPGAVPVLVIDSGDTVVLSVPDVSWGIEAPTSTTLPRRKVEPRDPVAFPALDSGPCLAGPVAVRGARPGDLLEIQIQRVVPGAWGWTYAGAGMANPGWNTALGIEAAPLTLINWTLDHAHGTARGDLGFNAPLRPFPGTIGLAPVIPCGQAFASGWLPSACGGNMDCRELVAGSTLMLPVMVEGALLSAGDGHAAQGDGELSGTAIECPLDELHLHVTLHHGRTLAGPRILSAPDTAGHRRRITIGIGATLDDAAAMATSAMLDWMQEHLGRTRAQCLALASSTVSLRVTQTVNPLKGIHAEWGAA